MSEAVYIAIPSAGRHEFPNPANYVPLIDDEGMILPDPDLVMRFQATFRLANGEWFTGLMTIEYGPNDSIVIQCGSDGIEISDCLLCGSARELMEHLGNLVENVATDSRYWRTKVYQPMTLFLEPPI